MGTWADEMDGLAAEVVGAFGDENNKITVRRGRGQPGTVNFASGVAESPAISEFSCKANELPVQVMAQRGQGEGGRAKIDEAVFSVRTADCAFIPSEGDLVLCKVATGGGSTTTVTRRISIAPERECSGAMLKITCRGERR